MKPEDLPPAARRSKADLLAGVSRSPYLVPQAPTIRASSITITDEWGRLKPATVFSPPLEPGDVAEVSYCFETGILEARGIRYAARDIVITPSPARGVTGRRPDRILIDDPRA